MHQLNLCISDQIHTANQGVPLTTSSILDIIRILGNDAAIPVLIGATHDNSRCTLRCDSPAITVLAVCLGAQTAAFAEELGDCSRHIIGIWAAVGSLADNLTVLARSEKWECIDC